MITLDKGAPTKKDVAVQLSRIPRWAGGTRPFWSVGQHSLICYDLTDPKRFPDYGDFLYPAKGDGSLKWIYRPEHIPFGPELLLTALWHDAHEFATEDAPPPFKSEQTKEWQRELDKRIWEKTLGLPWPSEEIWETVEWIDKLVTCSEAHSVCHPRVSEDFPHSSNQVIGTINNRVGHSRAWTRTEFLKRTEKLLTQVKEQYGASRAIG